MVDSARDACRHLTESILLDYTSDGFARECLRKRLAKRCTALAGSDPTLLEALRAERAAVCWPEVNRYESHFEQVKELTVRQADYHQRKIDAAHRRYLRALRTLAHIRKRGGPSVQVNAIGRNSFEDSS
jgi:hypothetical protein